MQGKPVSDIWTDISLNCKKGKRFPTQKPEAFLERIISSSSNPEQIIYEPFSGSATSAAVCHKLFRRWIGSEISENACSFALDRLNKIGCDVKLFSEGKILPKESSKKKNMIHTLFWRIVNVNSETG